MGDSPGKVTTHVSCKSMALVTILQLYDMVSPGHSILALEFCREIKVKLTEATLNLSRKLKLQILYYPRIPSSFMHRLPGSGSQPYIKLL